MDGKGFDELARRLATQRSRRSVLRGLVGGGAALVAVGTGARLTAAQDKVTICHWSEDLGYYELISVSGNAVAAHQAHQHGLDIISPDFTSANTCGDCSTVCYDVDPCTPAACIEGACNEIPACSGYETCGGGGVEGQCGCRPTFTAEQCDGVTCGEIPDGCGFNVTCGCTAVDGCTPAACIEGECNAVSACSPIDACTPAACTDDGCNVTSACTAVDTCTPAACIDGTCNGTSACTAVDTCTPAACVNGVCNTLSNCTENEVCGAEGCEAIEPDCSNVQLAGYPNNTLAYGVCVDDYLNIYVNDQFVTTSTGCASPISLGALQNGDEISLELGDHVPPCTIEPFQLICGDTGAVLQELNADGFFIGRQYGGDWNGDGICYSPTFIVAFGG